MKLPFDLGVKLFFRLLLPGFFVTLGFLPVLLALLDAVGLKTQHEVGFVLAIIVTGWLVVAADMPIYMLIEGRRYWPGLLWRWQVGSELRRLKALNDTINAYAAIRGRGESNAEMQRRYIEASVAKRSFPMQDSGDVQPEFPTRLGNAITAFETYSDTRYGLDTIFYWPRIWVNLNKDLREEIDNQQAMADSLVYSTVALALLAGLWAVYGTLTLLVPLVGSWLLQSHVLRTPFSAGVFEYLPGAGTSFLLAVVGAALSYSVYRLAVFANEQFGTVFTAVIDAHAAKVKSDYVDVSGIVRKVDALTQTRTGSDDELEVARRYLQYYNARVEDGDRAIPIPRISKALASDVPPV